MITYLIDNSQYSFNYTEVRDEYENVVNYSDEEFLLNIPKILHLSCFICFIKETPSYVCLSDKGIIHELVHILSIENYTNWNKLHIIRNNFKETCRLS